MSIPHDVITGSSQRRWLRLDSPELGHLSNQKVNDSQAAGREATVTRTDKATPGHHHAKRNSADQDGVDGDTSGDA